MNAESRAAARPITDLLVETAEILAEMSRDIQESLREDRDQLRSKGDGLKPGDKLMAKILDHFVRRLEEAGIEYLFQVLDEMKQISVWLPIADVWRNASPEELKANKIVLIQGMGLDQETKEAVYKLGIYKPGRPPETRAVALAALELRMQGRGWKEIEELLLPHRRGVKNPGESIRREVQLLRKNLRRLGILIESV